MAQWDLNLLHLFNLLFEERSVSAVARRLNLTQSAVSHSLARLREMVGDPLFTRSPNALRPTARAEELAPQVREIMMQVRAALKPPAFDPGSSRRAFTIATAPFFCRHILPSVIEAARRSAPGIEFRIVNVEPSIMEALDEGTVDMAVGTFSEVPARIKVLSALRDPLVWVCSSRHALAGAHPDVATLESLPRLLVVREYPYRALRDGGGDRGLRRQQFEEPDLADTQPGRRGRQTPVRVYDTEAAAAMIGQTDMVAMLPSRLAKGRQKDAGLHIFDASTGEPDIELMMLWHERFDAEPGLAWVRALILETTAKLGAAPSLEATQRASDK
jgi:DNA-binding transcriptional LysR family regulator